jgi:hypothetical protein
VTRIRVGVAVVSWIVLVGALAIDDAQPNLVALAAIVAVVVAFVATAIDLGRAIRPVRWTRPLRVAQPVRDPDARVQVLRQQVRAATLYRSGDVRLAMVAIVDDRLLAHHGIDRHVDPDAADAVLTERLCRLVRDAGPRGRAPDLSAILDDIERL